MIHCEKRRNVKTEKTRGDDGKSEVVPLLPSSKGRENSICRPMIEGETIERLEGRLNPNPYLNNGVGGR